MDIHLEVRAVFFEWLLTAIIKLSDVKNSLAVSIHVHDRDVVPVCVGTWSGKQ